MVPAEIAEEMNQSPVEAALELIKQGSVGIASFNMNEKDVNGKVAVENGAYTGVLVGRALLKQPGRKRGTGAPNSALSACKLRIIC
jgi:hypothetical protein